MKKSELTFRVALIPLDYLAVAGAGVLAYSLRFGPVREVRPVLFELSLGSFLALDAIVAAVWVLALATGGAYALRTGRRAVGELRRVFLGSTVALATLAFLVFLKLELVSSRFIVLALWAIALALVSVVHLVVRALQRSAYRRGVGIHRAVVIGTDAATEDLVAELYRDPTIGVRVVERIRDGHGDVVSALRTITQRFSVDEVIVGEASVPNVTLLAVKEHCDAHHLVFRYVASLFQAQAVKVDVVTVAGLPVVEVLRTSLDGWGKVFKRAFDLVVASLLLIFLSPAMAAVAVAVALGSRGPLLVHLSRIGVRGKTFRLLKFRSMVVGAEQLKGSLAAYNERADGPLFKMEHDPRVTRVGQTIRRYSLDELPQLWNVIRGDMSLVGPRPHEPVEVAQYQVAEQQLLVIKPGLTGLAQISGRSNLKFSDEVRLDRFYVENWSPWLDLQILAKTPAAVFSGRSAV